MVLPAVRLRAVSTKTPQDASEEPRTFPSPGVMPPGSGASAWLMRIDVAYMHRDADSHLGPPPDIKLFRMLRGCGTQ